MNDYEIRYSDQAEEDILSIHRFTYEISQSLDTANEIVESLISYTDRLNFMPERFKKYESANGPEGLRMYPVKSFVIFYRINKIIKLLK